jgi:hypothetical protein
MRYSSAFRPLALVCAFLLITGVATEGSDNVYVSMAAASARAAAAAQARAAARAQLARAESAARSSAQAAVAASNASAVAGLATHIDVAVKPVATREQSPECDFGPGHDHRFHHHPRHPYGNR